MAHHAPEKYAPLLELLKQRWDEFVGKLPDPTLHKPVARPHFSGDNQLRQAAREHAQADNSDPFAYGRAMRYMRQGYWLPSEVVDEARGRTRARVNNGAHIVTPFNTGEKP